MPTCCGENYQNKFKYLDHFWKWILVLFMNVTVCLSISRLLFLTPFYISELPNYSKHMALEALNYLGIKGLAYLGSFLFQIVLLKAIPTKAMHHYAASESYLLKHKAHHLHFLTALLQFYSAKWINLFGMIWFWSLFPSWAAFCGRTYSFPLLEISRKDWSGALCLLLPMKHFIKIAHQDFKLASLLNSERALVHAKQEGLCSAAELQVVWTLWMPSFQRKENTTTLANVRWQKNF